MTFLQLFIAILIVLLFVAAVIWVRRIGIGETFVHIGIATDKPQDVLWLYDRDPLTPDPLAAKEV